MPMTTSWRFATEARLGNLPFALTGQPTTHNGRSGMALAGTLKGALHGADLANELQRLSPVDLPIAVLSALELKDVTVAINTASDSVLVQGHVDISLFGQSFPTLLRCRVQHGSGQDRVLLDGTLTLREDLALAVAFETHSSGHTVLLTWRAHQHPLNLNDLLGLLELGDHVLPHGADFSLESLALRYAPHTNSLCCSFNTSYGNGFVQHAAGATAIGFRFSGSRTLSDLPGIGSLMPAVSALAFEHLSFSYATDTMHAPGGTAFPSLPDEQRIATSWFEDQELVKGLWLGARLDLNGSGNDALRKLGALAGVRDLWLSFDWQPGASVVHARADLGNKLCLPGGHLGCIIGIDKPGFALTMQQDAASVMVNGTCTLSLFGHRLSTVVRLSMSENAVDLSMEPHPANAAIPIPAGVKMVLTDLAMELGLEVEPPALTMGLTGNLLLGPRKNMVAKSTVVMAMEGEAPDPLYLFGDLSEIDLAQVVALVAGQHVPALKAFGLYHAFCSWSETAVQLPNGTTAQPGIAFGGGLQLFGFDAYSHVQLHGTHASRTITFSPVSCANVCALTGQGKGVVLDIDGKDHAVVEAGGPVFDMTPTAALSGGDFLSGSASLSLLGVSGLTAQVGVSVHGMRVKAAINMGVATSDFTGSIDAWGKLTGSFDMSVAVRTSISAGIAGSIDLDTSVDGVVHLEASAHSATVSVSGSFDFRGDRFSIGTIDLSTHSMGEIEGAVIRKTLDEAPHLLARFVSEAITAAEQAAERAAEATARAAREAAEAAARERAEQAARETREQAEAASRDVDHVSHDIRHFFSGW